MSPRIARMQVLKPLVSSQSCLAEQDWAEESERSPRHGSFHTISSVSALLACCLDAVWIKQLPLGWGKQTICIHTLSLWKKGKEPLSNPDSGTATERRTAAASDKKSHHSLSCHASALSCQASACSKRDSRSFKPNKQIV